MTLGSAGARRVDRAVGAILVVLAIGLCAAADRQWQTGTWTDAGVARDLWIGGAGGSARLGRTPTVTTTTSHVATYVIETADLRFDLKDVVPVGRSPLDVTVGQPVTFAVSKNTVYIRNADGSEHRLRLIKKTQQSKP